LKAVRLRRYGGNEGVRVEGILRPPIGPTDVCIEVRAAGVIAIDCKIRDGAFRSLKQCRLPFTLGCELSGVVVERGSHATRFRLGDAVLSLAPAVRLGAFAELAVVDEKNVALKPPKLSHLEAASLPSAGLAAWQALVDHAHLEPGRRLLVQGGGSDTGLVAVQLGAHLGAHVIATVRPYESALVRALGAHETIDEQAQSFDRSVYGCDVVLDTTGGAALERSFAMARCGGHVVSTGAQPTADFARKHALPLWVTWSLRLRKRRSFLRARARGVRYTCFVVEPDGEQLSTLAALVRRGAIKPVVGSVFPLEQAREALAYAEGQPRCGKVLIRVRRQADPHASLWPASH
jgi:NADPH:quinone reductase-like Zn-dependent oxidoreductase